MKSPKPQNIIPKLIFALLFLCFALQFQAIAQEEISKKAKQKYEDARTEMGNRNLEKGIKILEKLLEDEPNYLTARVLLINTYRMLGMTDKAELHCNTAANLKPKDPQLAPIYLQVMDFSIQKGEYEKAKEFANRFLTVAGSRPNNLTAMCRRVIASCDYAVEGMKKPVEFKPRAISKATNRLPIQYFPVLSADQQTMIFTARVGDKADQDENIYSMKKVNGEWGEPEFIKSLNTFQNEGTCTISGDGRIMIFTTCKGSEERPIYGQCDLFITYNEGGEWTKPQNMGAVVNSKSYDTQPSLSADGRTLYFVSNRPGGFGKEDIWVTNLDAQGQWTKPRNLGSTVNTAELDNDPFIHANGKTLFFSSDGHVGYGGSDIFKADFVNGDWASPENLGYPINDHKDQRGMVISPDGKTGYYSQGVISQERKSYSQIYDFPLPPEIKINPSNYVKGKVYDAKTKKLLQAKIDLINLRTDSIESTVFSDKQTGEYLIMLNKGSEYALYVNKEMYLFKSLTFNYIGNENKDVEIDIYLEQVIQGSKITLNNIFFDFAKWTLQDKSKTELNRLLDFLQKNPTLKVEIGGHTDNVGNPKFNLELSDKRAAEVVKYLKDNGLDTKRISSKGYGETQPVEKNDTEENKARNRRIEFKIL
jgi:outer membrane protein OmpA-like peptidoglycan-associated protein/Tol biopolymer transport system component